MKNPLLWNDFVFKLTATGKEHDRYIQILHKFTEDVSVELIYIRIEASVHANKSFMYR